MRTKSDEQLAEELQTVLKQTTKTITMNEVTVMNPLGVIGYVLCQMSHLRFLNEDGKAFYNKCLETAVDQTEKRLTNDSR